jgi:hypothetical protein
MDLERRHRRQGLAIQGYAMTYRHNFYPTGELRQRKPVWRNAGWIALWAVLTALACIGAVDVMLWVAGAML